VTTRHLVDPEIAPLIELFPPFAFSPEALPEIRVGISQMLAEGAKLAPPVPSVEVSERLVPGPAGAPDVPVLLYQPKDAARPAPGLLWIHGGGYVIGAAAMDDVNCKLMAAELGCTIVSVDYRLAPETPHPGPVEDCYAALKWMHASAMELGVDPGRIAIGGTSAGGGLAAGLGLLTRDRAEVPLCFQLLNYPMLDDRTVTTYDPHPHVGEFVWTPDDNHFGWASLLGQEPGSAGVSPYAAAARAEDLTGLPPTYIAVGALDLFLEEDMEYARRLVRAGVPTELHLYPGCIHGFLMMADATVSKAYTRDMMSALRRALQPQVAPAAT
jgi:acetyl esterase/lipase